MGQRVFIPVYQQPYVLSEDATFLLYPMLSNFDLGSFHAECFYGVYDKKKHGFTHHYNVRFVEYAEDPTSEGYKIATAAHQGSEFMNSYCVVTEQEYPDAVLKQLKGPKALVKLGIGPVYVLAESWENRINSSYAVFVPGPDPFKSTPSSKKHPQVKKLVKELPAINQAHVDRVKERALRFWNAAQALEPQLAHMVNKYIPIWHTIPAGSSFQITHGITPHGKQQRYVQALIEGRVYTITTDQLVHFVLDEVQKPKRT